MNKQIAKSRTAAYTLCKEGLEDPYKVIDELFDFDHYPGIKTLLWKWFKMTVLGNYCSEETSSFEKGNTIILYEKIDKLIDAVWEIKKSKTYK